MEPLPERPKIAKPPEADRHGRGRIWFIVAWCSLAASLYLFALWAGDAMRFRSGDLVFVLLSAAAAATALVFAMRGSMIAYWGLLLLQLTYLVWGVLVFAVALHRNFSALNYWYAFIFLVVGWTFIPFLGRGARAYVRHRRARRAALAATVVTPARIWFIVAWCSLAASLYLFALVAGDVVRFKPGALVLVLLPAAAAATALAFAMRGSMIAYWGLLLLQLTYLVWGVLVFAVALHRNFSALNYWYAFIFLVVGWTFIPFLGRGARAYVRHRRARRAALAATVVTPARAP